MVVAPRSKGISPAYKNASLPIERRVKDLLSRMTLAEKAAQMMCVWQQKAEKLVDASGAFDLEKARPASKMATALAR
jgi:beta-glucosidase